MRPIDSAQSDQREKDDVFPLLVGGQLITQQEFSRRLTQASVTRPLASCGVRAAPPSNHCIPRDDHGSVSQTYNPRLMSQSSQSYGSPAASSRDYGVPQGINRTVSSSIGVEDMSEGSSGSARSIPGNLILTDQGMKKMRDLVQEGMSRVSLGKWGFEYRNKYTNQEVADIISQDQSNFREYCKIVRNKSFKTVPRSISSDTVAKYKRYIIDQP